MTEYALGRRADLLKANNLNGHNQVVTRYPKPHVMAQIRTPWPGPSPSERQARRRAWARLIRRVFEFDPLVCAKCGGEMRIISVILEPAVITTILEHLRNKGQTDPCAPPNAAASLEAAS
jgi:hypothetical protein